MKQSTSNQKKGGESHQNLNPSTRSLILLASLLIFFQFFNLSCTDTQLSSTALEKQINPSTAVQLSEEDKAIIEKCQAQYDKTLFVYFRAFEDGVLQDYLDGNRSKGMEKIQAIIQEEYKSLDSSIDENFKKSLTENTLIVNGKVELKEGELKTAMEIFNRQLASQKQESSITTLVEIRNRHLPNISVHYDKVAFVFMTNVSLATLDAAKRYLKEHYMGHYARPSYDYYDASLLPPSVFQYKDIKSALVCNYRPVFLQYSNPSMGYYDYHEARMYQRYYSTSRSRGFHYFVNTPLFDRRTAVYYGFIGGFSSVGIGGLYALFFGGGMTAPVVASRGIVGFASGYSGNAFSQYTTIANDTATIYTNSIHYRERHSGSGGGARGGGGPRQQPQQKFQYSR